MNVFLNTEFTNFLGPSLITLGLASEYGEDFYAEVPYPGHVSIRIKLAIGHTLIKDND